MKMGRWRSASAWVTWNRKVLQILTNWFSEALQAPIKIHYHDCTDHHRNLNVAMWGCAAEALTATVFLFTYRK